MARTPTSPDLDREARRLEPSHPARLLAIADNPADLQLLASVMRIDGYEIDTALGGEQGVAAAIRLLPDVVLLDLDVADLDGFEVLNQLKGRGGSREPIDAAIIVVSASVRDGDVVRALELGATDFVTKPFNYRILLARVAAAVRSRRERVARWMLGEDLRIAQEELARSLRRLALGAIATGIAHDVNNPAAVVVSNLHEARELAFELASFGDPQHANTLATLVEESLSGMARIRDSMRDLEIFSSGVDPPAGSTPDVRVVDLGALLKARVGRLQATVDTSLSIEVPGAPESPYPSDSPKSPGATGPSFPVAATGRVGAEGLEALIALLLRGAGAAEGMSSDETARTDRAVRVRLRREGRVAVIVVEGGRRGEIGSGADDPFVEFTVANGAGGLGLMIAAELAERFGGTLTCEARRGRETRYVLRLDTVA